MLAIYNLDPISESCLKKGAYPNINHDIKFYKKFYKMFALFFRGV